MRRATMLIPSISRRHTPKNMANFELLGWLGWVVEGGYPLNGEGLCDTGWVAGIDRWLGILLAACVGNIATRLSFG